MDLVQRRPDHFCKSQYHELAVWLADLFLRAKMQSMFFVMPHFRNAHPTTRYFFQRAIASIRQQSDDGWRLVVVDDASPQPVQQELLELKASDSRIAVILLQNNLGPGECRNIGIRYAANQGAQAVLFLDADDEAHANRVRVTRKIFRSEPEVDVVYSAFIVIDEQNRPVNKESLTPSVRQILDNYQTAPPEGWGLWRTMGLRTGYLNLTSATSVRTALALRQPFPKERVSEDFHTWLRFSADGGYFRFVQGIPTCYRIPKGTDGSHSRQRFGRAFYRRKARVDRQGFMCALDIACRRGEISPKEKPALLHAFEDNLRNLLAEEGILLP